MRDTTLGEGREARSCISGFEGFQAFPARLSVRGNA
jgi:hypothetical protein